MVPAGMKSPGWGELENRGHSEPQPDFPQRGVNRNTTDFPDDVSVLNPWTV
jgi:hypothetical protein